MAVVLARLHPVRSKPMRCNSLLAGLLRPRDRPKTLTAIDGAAPLAQAQAAKVQQLQYFLSESAWDAEALAGRTRQLLMNEPGTAPSGDGVLVLDDTGDRKKGHAADHVGRQYLGSIGKIDNGIVAVTTLWADEQHYYPLDVAPYTPAGRLADGQQDPAFHTKPQLARMLAQRGLPYVLAHSGQASRGRGPEEMAHVFKDAAQDTPQARLASGDTPLPRWTRCALVGNRLGAVWRRPGQTGAGALRHHRPPCAP